jgi:hypothetical protein
MGKSYVGQAVLVLEKRSLSQRMDRPTALEGSRFCGWRINLAIFFTARLPPKHVLNRRLPRVTQRIVLAERPGS